MSFTVYKTTEDGTVVPIKLSIFDVFRGCFKLPQEKENALKHGNSHHDIAQMTSPPNDNYGSFHHGYDNQIATSQEPEPYQSPIMKPYNKGDNLTPHKAPSAVAFTQEQDEIILQMKGENPPAPWTRISEALDGNCSKGEINQRYRQLKAKLATEGEGDKTPSDFRMPVNDKQPGDDKKLGDDKRAGESFGTPMENYNTGQALGTNAHAQDNPYRSTEVELEQEHGQWRENEQEHGQWRENKQEHKQWKEKDQEHAQWEEQEQVDEDFGQGASLASQSESCFDRGDERIRWNGQENQGDLWTWADRYDEEKWLSVASRHFDKTGERISPERARMIVEGCRCRHVHHRAPAY